MLAVKKRVMAKRERERLERIFSPHRRLLDHAAVPFLAPSNTKPEYTQKPHKLTSDNRKWNFKQVQCDEDTSGEISWHYISKASKGNGENEDISQQYSVEYLLFNEPGPCIIPEPELEIEDEASEIPKHHTEEPSSRKKPIIKKKTPNRLVKYFRNKLDRLYAFLYMCCEMMQFHDNLKESQKVYK